MESLLLAITYETSPIEKKRKRKNAGTYNTTTRGAEPIWKAQTLTTTTGGTEPMAPTKLLNRIKVSERLRYELEQRFLFQKKNPGVKWDPLEVTLSTRPGRSDVVGDADPARTTHITILIDYRLTDRVEHEVLPGRD